LSFLTLTSEPKFSINVHAEREEEMRVRRRRKPTVFIGSSAEGLSIAKHLQAGLDHSAECTVWSQGVFGLSHGVLDAVLRASRRYDFAVLVLTADDRVLRRRRMRGAPRDNVLFELGLFLGALGADRTFFVYCRDDRLGLPTDLAGVVAATFARRRDGNLDAALGPVCLRLEEEFARRATA
jgi:predicted nucleotide-binding protein